MWYEYPSPFSTKFLTIIYQGQRTTFVDLEMEYTPLPLLQVSLVDDGGLTIVQQWKADDYVLTGNGDESLRFRVLLLNRVVVGKPHKRRRNATWLTEPPHGHHPPSSVFFPTLNATRRPLCLINFRLLASQEWISTMRKLYFTTTMRFVLLFWLYTLKIPWSSISNLCSKFFHDPHYDISRFIINRKLYSHSRIHSHYETQDRVGFQVQRPVFHVCWTMPMPGLYLHFSSCIRSIHGMQIERCNYFQ